LKNGQQQAPSGEQPSIADSIWKQVRVETVDSLALDNARDTALIDVTISNDSCEPLNLAAEQGTTLSFRLIGIEGRPIPFEYEHPPLKDLPGPGASISRSIEVVIPEAYVNQVTAIRVGLFQHGSGWIERINRRHSKTVRISLGTDMTDAQHVVYQASQLWPQGKGNGLRWPHGTMMVSEPHQILYIPIAKCACTSLKSMMVELAGIEHYEKALELGVHFVTDRFNTGVQLKDKSMKRAWQILASHQYYKFSVVREPFERLVSAYLEKFVFNRKQERNLLHTRSLISQVQDTRDIDLQRGVSFDEFVTYILAQPPQELDPHWRPQYLYLAGVKHISRIFRLEDIGELEAHLRQDFGVTAQLEHRNKTEKSRGKVSGISQMTADQIDTLEAFDPDSFLSSKHRDAVQKYYQEDFELYTNATE
jgi:hypothetical protein